MGEIFGGILKGLGFALNAIYEVVGSYGLAIILLTIGVRLLLVPLTVKQIRSMTAMQKIQPHMKDLQKKHKGDRQKLNEELMKLYKEHNVNPLGGCVPLLAQMPVFIALFSLLRASIPVVASAVTLVSGTPADALSADQLKNTLCRPERAVSAAPQQELLINCETSGKDVPSQSSSYRIADFRAAKDQNSVVSDASTWLSVCVPVIEETQVGDKTEKKTLFSCRSALGTGHIPKDGELFADVTEDRATFLSMHLGCSATQVGSKTTVKQCTADPEAGGGAHALPYYLLIALIIGTSFYQARQMVKRSTGQAAQQQQMMMKVMPVLFGFISLSIPSGTNVYFFVSNLWTIGQQALIFRNQDQPTPTNGAKPSKTKAQPPAGKEDGAKGATQQTTPRKRKRKR